MATLHPQADPLNPPPANTKHIWKTFFILVGVTAVEFIFAFTMSRGALLTSIFVLLTIVKAYFIVGEFMHLGHEKKSLVYSVIMPMMFVLWGLVAMLMEGAYYLQQNVNYFN